MTTKEEKAGNYTIATPTRDEIAVAAMQGMLAFSSVGMYSKTYDYSTIPTYSYKMADAMLKARDE